MEWFNLTGKLHQIKIALPAASVKLSRRFLTQPRPAQPVLNWGFKAAKGGFAWGRHLFNKAKTVVKKTNQNRSGHDRGALREVCAERLICTASSQTNSAAFLPRD